MTKEEFDKLFPQVAENAEKAQNKELDVQTQIEWHIARFGYVTGSEVHRIEFTEDKPALSSSRRTKIDWLQSQGYGAALARLEAARVKAKKKALDLLPVSTINAEFEAAKGSLIPSQKTVNYAHELAGQLLLNLEQLRESETVPRWLETSSIPTDWGKKHEPVAREAVAGLGYKVENPPQMQHPTLSFVRYNADGVLRDSHGCKGLLEIKCPHNPSIHNQTLLAGTVLDKKHLAQICLGMILANADFCLFASFDPRTIKSAQLAPVRVERVNFASELWQMELNLRLFWADVYRPILQRYVKKGLLLDCPFLV